MSYYVKMELPIKYCRVRLLSLHRRCTSTSSIIVKENLPAGAYQPKLIENKKNNNWESDGIFKAENSSENPNFSMVLPPPNVTGKLHLGHALACTIQDVIVRRQRALGHNVMWLPGTDHAGIATQGVVEKYLTAHNIKRHDIGREKFNKEVWKWKEKHSNTIYKQLRVLGCSLDWSREIFTMDPRHTHAVNSAFIQLFKQGLIYRRKALVNWCGKLKSTVSDIEVENRMIYGPTEMDISGYDEPVKFGLLYSFGYEVVGQEEQLVVSTTMPETMLGDSGIAVHPDDSRYTHLIGKFVKHPFLERQIPIIADRFVDMEFGTGAVKITPAHSKTDYDVAKLHNLPMIQVVGEDGLMKNSGRFDAMKRYECRKKLVNTLQDLGLLKEISPHRMTLPLCSRTGDVIEHLPKEQWFLSCGELNKKAQKLVKENKLKILPKKFVKNWLDWTGDNRDWCISRQLWWGHQVPAYRCQVDQDVVWVAAHDACTARAHAALLLRSGPEDVIAERDSDVLDTWFSSGIYPFASLGWPQDSYSADYKDFYPLSLMVTGHDILGFWVHRMVILGLQLTGTLPFNQVLLHGVICDSKGMKMSKSRGNVIDPIDVVDGISMEALKEKTEDLFKSGVLNKEEFNRALTYHRSHLTATDGIPECGADALRFTLLTQDIKSHFVNFDLANCHANKLFCNKIWQSVKYLQLSFAKLKPIDTEITTQDLTLFDRWILSRLADMVEKVDQTMDNYNFHLTTKAIKTLIYNEFCDVYLETTKTGFEQGNKRTGYAHAHTLSAVLHASLRCLSPFMIYLTAEVIPKIPSFEKSIIHNFNDLEDKCFEMPHSEDFRVWRDEELEARVGKLLGAISLVRELKGYYGVSHKLQPTVYVKTEDSILSSNLAVYKAAFLNLTRCIDVKLVDNLPPKANSIKGILDLDTEINVEIVGEHVADAILAAREKLLKKAKKLEESMDKMESRLASSQYLSTAPEWLQTLDREKLNTKKKLLQQLQRLI